MQSQKTNIILNLIEIGMTTKNTNPIQAIEKFLNTISASKMAENLEENASYLFFLNANGRFVANTFFFVFNQIPYLATTSSNAINLKAHVAKLDFRKQIILTNSTNLHAYLKPNEYKNPVPTQMKSFLDPRNLGEIIITPTPLNLETLENYAKSYTNEKIINEIADLDDFEFERSVILEYGKISKFISTNKGCYIGQELMQRTRVLGQVRKTIKAIPTAQINAYEVLKILAQNENFTLALVRG